MNSGVNGTFVTEIDGVEFYTDGIRHGQGHRVWDFGASRREHTWNNGALLVEFYSEFHQIFS
jgi:hypothetical protein